MTLRIRVLAGPLFALSLAACSSWFGEAEIPLPGERISVLLHERELRPDLAAGEAAILLPPPSPNDDWPQSGGYANHAMHHMEVGDTLRRAWSLDFGVGISTQERFLGTPIIGEGRIYAMDSESVVSTFDASSGNRLWSRDLTPDDEDDGHFSGGLAYENGVVYAATGFAQVVALDAGNGKEIWRSKVGGPLHAAPTVHGGRVFALAIDNSLYALSAYDGSRLWTHKGLAREANLLGSASPAADEGVVVVPYSSGELLGLSVDTGDILWSDSLAPSRNANVVSTLAHIRGNPVIDRGRVFAMSYGGTMVSLDLRSGRRFWDKDVGGPDAFWVAGNFLFAVTRNSEVLCIARNSGRIHWVQPLPHFEDEKNKEDPIIWSGPVLASDRLIVAGSNREALALSPYSGRILGKITLPASVSMPPIVANRMVFFITDDAELVAYR